MKILFLIGLGSFFGGTSRYLLQQYIQARFLSAFPFGTLAVNLTGCFLIGLVFGLANKWNLGTEWKMFLATGFLGGFTTFSAFSNETINLIHDEQFIHAILYVLASVLLGLAATAIAYIITKNV
ncbi:putative fluoride ion transporter CrcB [Bacteroidia bacterium]|nr:putative fluoride ion transporter CrcB [Bacteroidia bacterium]GHV07577.1 putative fluoride ion transporter CrcB [Bacteroidia bacterium]